MLGVDRHDRMESVVGNAKDLELLSQDLNVEV